MDELEITHDLRPRCKLKDSTPSLSYIIAKTLVTSGGMTTRELTDYVMKTYSRFGSMKFDSLIKTVGSLISKSKFYYKKSRYGNVCTWAVLPKYKSFVRDISPVSFRRDRKRKQSSHDNDVDEPKKYLSVNNGIVNFEFRQADGSEENDPMNADEAMVPQFGDLGTADFQKLLDEFAKELPLDNESEMSNFYGQELEDEIKIENFDESLNQDCSDESDLTGMFATANNNDCVIIDGDVVSSILEETKYVESTDISFPTNATTNSMKHLEDNNREKDVPLCTMCNLSFFTNEELGEHVLTQHNDRNDQLTNNIVNNLWTALENVRPQAPIKVYIMTGNQNVYITPTDVFSPDNSTQKTDS